MCIRCRHSSAHGALCATVLSARWTAKAQHCSIMGCPSSVLGRTDGRKANKNLGAGKAELGREEGDPAVTSITCLEIKTSSVENTKKEQILLENINSTLGIPNLSFGRAELRHREHRGLCRHPAEQALGCRDACAASQHSWLSMHAKSIPVRDHGPEGTALPLVLSTQPHRPASRAETANSGAEGGAALGESNRQRII